MRDLISDYMTDKSWRKKENANVNESFSNLQYFLASNMLANDFLASLPRKHKRYHRDALIHIHNLESGGYIPYCAGHNLKQLIVYGMKTQTINSKPAKHFGSLIDQIMNWFYMSQQEFAGAQAFSDFDTLVAPFIRVNKLNYRQVKQQIQKLVFNLNYTMRASNQSPFTNLTLNYGVPKYLRELNAIVGGETQDFSYEECLNEIYLVDEAINNIMTEGDPVNKPFTFPILTLNLTKDLDWNHIIIDILLENLQTRGSYYFMNYIGSGITEDTIRAMCCRLNIRLKELSGPIGLWNTIEGTGSLGVVTINFSRLGYDCKGKDERTLFEKLSERLEIAYDILLMRKKRIKKHMKRLMPFSLMNNWTMRTYYITIGVIALNELCLNYLGSSIVENIDFTIKVLNYTRKWILDKQKEERTLINLEMIPGEGSSYRLAFIDRKLKPKIKTLGTRSKPYYSSLLIPPSLGIPLLERIPLEEKVLPLFSGGTIFRVYLGEKIPNKESLLNFIRKMSKTKIPYFDITNTYSVCTKEGLMHRSILYKCPNCNSRTEVYSRVVGYYRPVSKWNVGKVQEFKDRQYVSL